MIYCVLVIFVIVLILHFKLIVLEYNIKRKIDFNLKGECKIIHIFKLNNLDYKRILYLKPMMFFYLHKLSKVYIKDEYGYTRIIYLIAKKHKITTKCRFNYAKINYFIYYMYDK